MIRERITASLREFAASLGPTAHGSQWHLFGSVEADMLNAADIDLMILCQTPEQADQLRQAIDLDAFELPLHVGFLTFQEAVEIHAVSVQDSRAIYPERRRSAR